MKSIHLSDRLHKGLKRKSADTGTSARELIELILEADLLKDKYVKIMDDIEEMSNVDPRDHQLGVDVKLHLLQPGDKKVEHAPRVKVFRGSAEFSITLNSNETKMTLVGESFLNKRETAKVLAGVKKLRLDFIKFWNDPKMSSRELNDLMDKTRSKK